MTTREGPSTTADRRRFGRAMAAGAALVVAGVVAGCSDDTTQDQGDLRPSGSSVSTASTTPSAGSAGDDRAEDRDNVDVDRDDSGAGSPSDQNSDEGSNAGGQVDDD